MRLLAVGLILPSLYFILAGYISGLVSLNFCRLPEVTSEGWDIKMDKKEAITEWLKSFCYWWAFLPVVRITLVATYLQMNIKTIPSLGMLPIVIVCFSSYDVQLHVSWLLKCIVQNPENFLGACWLALMYSTIQYSHRSVPHLCPPPKKKGHVW